MATEALGDERPALFLRNATGLVRGWNVRDSLIYAVPGHQLRHSRYLRVLLPVPHSPTGSCSHRSSSRPCWVSFLVVAYTGLIVTIPRAGGDYVWQTRILGSGLGFVMAATGWWFILWLWAPIYGNILSVELFQPLWATLGDPSGAAWFATHTGIFVVTLITIALAGVLVSIGMAGYARVQKWCFYGGLIGFAVIVVLLLVNSHANFVSLLQPGGAQDLRREQRLRQDAGGGAQDRLRLAPVRVQPARREPAAGPDDDVLPPVAELGRQPCTARSAARATSSGSSAACSSGCGSRSPCR